MASSGEPMKAKLGARAFSDPGWVFERKLDGIRALVRRDGAAVSLTSRTGNDLTAGYPELVEALAADVASDFLADGEIVAFEGSRTSFARLQGRMHIRDPELARASGIPVYLYLFDLLRFDGHDLTGLPLRTRKRLLRDGLRFAGPVRYTPHRNERGEDFFREACAKGWEGLIAKRAESAYVHHRSGDWIKLKCSREQELVIGGFTPPQGSRSHFGALLVGYYEGEELRFAGKVGTGFDQRTLAALGARLETLEASEPPFRREPALPRAARWVEPRLVGQFAFQEWTRDGRLRHPRFVGLRDDKHPREVVREVPTGLGRRVSGDASEFLPARRTVPALRRAVQDCRGCELWKDATQAVFGAGASGAELMLVGEQPGDREDREGEPFVGPAGKLLGRALEQAEIDGEAAYATNAVKHFKWRPRGKRRLHLTPRAGEVAACRPWLTAEIEAVAPRALVALGATATRSVFGAGVKVTRDRGRLLEDGPAPIAMVTVHPSAVLRAGDEREHAFAALVEDLSVVSAALRRR